LRGEVTVCFASRRSVQQLTAAQPTRSRNALLFEHRTTLLYCCPEANEPRIFLRRALRVTSQPLPRCDPAQLVLPPLVHVAGALRVLQRCSMHVTRHCFFCVLRPWLWAHATPSSTHKRLPSHAVKRALWATMRHSRLACLPRCFLCFLPGYPARHPIGRTIRVWALQTARCRTCFRRRTSRPRRSVLPETTLRTLAQLLSEAPARLMQLAAHRAASRDGCR